MAHTAQGRRLELLLRSYLPRHPASGPEPLARRPETEGGQDALELAAFHATLGPNKGTPHSPLRGRRW